MDPGWRIPLRRVFATCCGCCRTTLDSPPYPRPKVSFPLVETFRRRLVPSHFHYDRPTRGRGIITPLRRTARSPPQANPTLADAATLNLPAKVYREPRLNPSPPCSCAVCSPGQRTPFDWGRAHPQYRRLVTSWPNTVGDGLLTPGKYPASLETFSLNPPAKTFSLNDGLSAAAEAGPGFCQRA